MDAREVSLQALYACHKQGGWSDGVLKKQLAQHGADRRDAAQRIYETVQELL